MEASFLKIHPNFRAALFEENDILSFAKQKNHEAEKTIPIWPAIAQLSLFLKDKHKEYVQKNAFNDSRWLGKVS